MRVMECISLAREFGIGTEKLLRGHVTPPLPAIVSHCSLAFRGLADDREIILQPANRGIQYAEKIAEDGHAPAYGLVGRFYDLAAAMNPSPRRSAYTIEAFWLVLDRNGGTEG